MKRFTVLLLAALVLLLSVGGGLFAQEHQKDTWYIGFGLGSGQLWMEDDTFDIVYIDADHSYYSVLKDLEKSRKKVKPGGIISGHDYSPRTQGVINAVNEFVNYYKIPIQLTTDDLLPSYIITNIK